MMDKNKEIHLRWLSIWALCLMFVCFAWTVSEARDFNVRGRVLFQDGDPSGPATGSIYPVLNNIHPEPGRFVKVMITRDGDKPICYNNVVQPSQGFCYIKGEGWTDNQGRFDVRVVGAPDNVQMKIFYELDNSIVKVWANTDWSNARIIAESRTTFNSGISGDIVINEEEIIKAYYKTLTVEEALWIDEDINVSFAGAMNINHVILKVWDDISANRAPGEDDEIEQVYVEYCDKWRSSHYLSDIVLLCSNSDDNPSKIDSGFIDEQITHEYGHHLEYTISSVDIAFVEHQFCSEIEYTWGVDDEVAWNEGFPDYLGMYIVNNNPGMTYVGTHDPENGCSGDFNSEISVEGNITAVLWDLTDGPGFESYDQRAGNGGDAWDIVDGKTIKGHQKIIQIFDKELDDYNVFDSPTLKDFYKAWVDRTGKDSLIEGQPALDMILNSFGIVPGEMFFGGGFINKMPPYGFIEAKPILPANSPWVSKYSPSTNTPTLEASWSYSDKSSWGGFPYPVDIKIGVSNLGDINMGVIGMQGSAQQAKSAEFYTYPVYTGGDGWLSVTLYGVITPGKLGQVLLQLDKDVVKTLGKGIHEAVVNVVFTITPVTGSAFTQTRTINVQLLVWDGGDDDPDGDGLTSREEVEILPNNNYARYSCLDPKKNDSDGDGLTDGEEVNKWHTNPCTSDSDGDGTKDRTEVDYMNIFHCSYKTEIACLNPNVPDEPDKDNDGLTNEEEYKIKQGRLHDLLNPCNPDTDCDGISDGGKDPDKGGPIEPGPDNCPFTPNTDQDDKNGDGIGDACQLDYELTLWLEYATQIDPLELLPHCLSCPPLPQWLQIYQFDKDTMIALQTNNVLPLAGDYSAPNLSLNGTMQIFALGSNESGILKITLGPLINNAIQRMSASMNSTVTGGVYALLLDADGNEVWRAEGIQDITEFTINLVPGKTYLLIVNGPTGTQASLKIDLPGAYQTTAGILKGFNLINIPLDMSGKSLISLLPLLGNSGQIEGLELIDKNAGMIREVYYDESGNPAGDNFTLSNGEGLIVNSKSDRVISFTGFAACPTLDLKAGMNIIGAPCALVDTTAFQLLRKIGNDSVVSGIQRYNPDTGKFETAGYLNGQAVGVNFPIKAGEGYFINMKKDVMGFQP
jgi:hypothetical protein